MYEWGVLCNEVGSTAEHERLTPDPTHIYTYIHICGGRPEGWDLSVIVGTYIHILYSIYMCIYIDIDRWIYTYYVITNYT